MIRHGVHPVTLNRKDASYHGTFYGRYHMLYFAPEMNLDVLHRMWNQEVDGYPYGCTGYAQGDNAGNADKTVYKPIYTYTKTCYIENHNIYKPCEVRNSLESTQIYGLQKELETTDDEAETHRRGAHFNIYDDGGMDWYDGLRNALTLHTTPLSIVTPWFGEWEVTQGGIVSPHFVYDGIPAHYPWHNWSIVGWKVIGDETYLIGKSWQGPDYGSEGYHYLDRATINKVMAIPGAAAFVNLPYTGLDIQTIEVSILQLARLLLYRILGLYQPLN